MFPNSIHGLQETVITCMTLTRDFLVFATDVSLVTKTLFVQLIWNLFLQLGNLVYFALETWTTVLRYRHSMGVKQIFGDGEGTKLVLVDDHNQGHIYLPVSWT